VGAADWCALAGQGGRGAAAVWELAGGYFEGAGAAGLGAAGVGGGRFAAGVRTWGCGGWSPALAGMTGSFIIPEQAGIHGSRDCGASGAPQFIAL